MSLSILRLNLDSFIALSRCPPDPKSLIFICNYIHIALHMFQSKSSCFDFALSFTRNPWFPPGIPPILLSALKLNLDPFVAISRCPRSHEFSFDIPYILLCILKLNLGSCSAISRCSRPESSMFILNSRNVALHIEVQCRLMFCGFALFPIRNH